MSLGRQSGRFFLHYSKFILPSGALAVLVNGAVVWAGIPSLTGLSADISRSSQSRILTSSTPALSGSLAFIATPAPGKSRLAGIPSVEKCMNCHRVTKTDSPCDQAACCDLIIRGSPLAWERIHLLPDHVYFDHRPHVNAGILCQTCHGEVQTMDVVYQKMSMRMSNCLGCHRPVSAASVVGLRGNPRSCKRRQSDRNH